MAKWREKERPMSFEEALDLTRSQLTPFWFKSKPLFAPSVGSSDWTREKSKDKAEVPESKEIFPLEDSFLKKPWVLIFVDPTEVNRKQSFIYAQELYRRYGMLDLGFILVLRSDYKLFSEREPVEKLIARNQIPFTVVVDHDGMYSKVFSIEKLPSLIVVDRGVKVIERAPENYLGAEVELQPFLRKTDPGLSLLAPWQIPTDTRFAKGRIEFGTKLCPQFPPPGVKVTGKWEREEERIVTEDPTASLEFELQGDGFSILGQTLARHGENANVLLEIGGQIIPQNYAGPDLNYDVEARSRVQLQTFGLNHVVENAPKGSIVKLKCADAMRAKVGLFGIRFSQKA